MRKRRAVRLYRTVKRRIPAGWRFWCQWCGSGPHTSSSVDGRAPKWCSDACKLRAARARAKGV
jgi:hypothetical protein